jgi:hypothetical protein
MAKGKSIEYDNEPFLPNETLVIDDSISGIEIITNNPTKKEFIPTPEIDNKDITTSPISLTNKEVGNNPIETALNTKYLVKQAFRFNGKTQRVKTVITLTDEVYNKIHNKKLIEKLEA